MPDALDVLAIGELNPDLILSGFAVAGPQLGTEQVFETQTLTLGSSTAIACVLMQRLGLATGMVALVGDDDHGRFCRETLAANGVDISGVRVDPAQKTGLTISLSYPSDRMLLTRYGTMAGFGIADIDLASLPRARHLHVGSFFIQSGLRPDLPGLFRAARGRGQTTSLDLGWDPAGRWDLDALRAVLPHVSVVFPNRVELAAVTGTDDPEAGLNALHRMGAAEIALKLGADGAIRSTPEARQRDPGFRVAPVDTTGAGDAFNAGFLAARLGGEDPAGCLALGNACGALTTRQIGGTSGLSGIDEARAFIRSAR
jgi:sugar/nucleoside kinase (ribokinase family)